MAQQGIIYSATGQRFVVGAITSALSSLRFNQVPHLVYCDVQPRQRFEGVEFVRFETCGNPFLDKVRNMARTPFERTIYLDNDTYVLDRLDDLFDLLHRFDLAAAHAAGYTKCEDRGQSEAFYDFNTGVIPYRRTGVVGAFLKGWAELSERWFSAPPFRLFGFEDQPAFRRLIWESPVSFYVLSPEYNYRFTYPGKVVGKIKILHGLSPNYEEVAAHANAEVKPRVLPNLSVPSRSGLELRLAETEEKFGPEHSSTAESLSVLAVRLHLDGDHARARQLFARALAIREKVLGAEHPDTVMTLENIARLYQLQGDPIQARSVVERVLFLREKVLGLDHPETKRAAQKLATF